MKGDEVSFLNFLNIRYGSCQVEDSVWSKRYSEWCNENSHDKKPRPRDYTFKEWVKIKKGHIDINEYNWVFPKEIEQLADEYEIKIREKGQVLEEIWIKCKRARSKDKDWWYDYWNEDEEKMEIGNEDYNPPIVHTETFEVTKYKLNNECRFLCVSGKSNETLSLGRKNGSRFRKMIMEEMEETLRDDGEDSVDKTPRKAYYSVLRQLIWKTLRDKGTPMKYIKVIQDMYEGARTCVRTPTGNSEYFLVDVELHQGSAISPYLFALILDELSRGYKRAIPWNENDQNEEAVIRIGKHILEPKESFRYLGSVIHKSGRIEDDVTHRIQAGWLKWRAATGILCDKNVPLKLKGKFYRVAIRAAMLWTCGKTLLDMIPNGAFRRNLQVATIVNKMREGRLRWFGHVKRRPQSAPVRRVETIVVDGVRMKGVRPKSGGGHTEDQTIKEAAVCLSEEGTSDRNSFAFVPRVFLHLCAFCAFMLVCPFDHVSVCAYVCLCVSYLYVGMLVLFMPSFPSPLMWSFWVHALLPEVFLEAVPLSLGRGVTVYIPPPPYLALAGLGTVVVVVVSDKCGDRLVPTPGKELVILPRSPLIHTF
ncbi:ataxia telangiectasia mutated family protein [Tanacetum coccineum]